MSDEELIAYCRAHARTERALFHAEHVRRLYSLAGVATPASLTQREWVVVREGTVDTLIARIQKKIQPRTVWERIAAD